MCRRPEERGFSQRPGHQPTNTLIKTQLVYGGKIGGRREPYAEESSKRKYREMRKSLTNEKKERRKKIEFVWSVKSPAALAVMPMNGEERGGRVQLLIHDLSQDC